MVPSLRSWATEALEQVPSGQSPSLPARDAAGMWGTVPAEPKLPGAAPGAWGTKQSRKSPQAPGKPSLGVT